MGKYVYLVELERGRSNKNYQAFLNNANSLYAKAPDYVGINNLCLLVHTQDSSTVHLLMTEGFKGNGSDLKVTEITNNTLDDEQGFHRIFSDTIDYFRRYNDLTNLS